VKRRQPAKMRRFCIQRLTGNNHLPLGIQSPWAMPSSVAIFRPAW